MARVQMKIEAKWAGDVVDIFDALCIRCVSFEHAVHLHLALSETFPETGMEACPRCFDCGVQSVW